MGVSMRGGAGGRAAGLFWQVSGGGFSEQIALTAPLPGSSPSAAALPGPAPCGPPRCPALGQQRRG